MKKFTIEDLSEGRCAVVNDGTVDELWEVLGKAFPKHPGSALATRMIYRSNPANNNYWYCCDKTSLPTQSVKDFLEKEEESEVINDMDTIERVVNDVRHLISAECSDETIRTRIENYIDEITTSKQPEQQPPLTSLDYDQLGEIAKTDNERGREALRMLLEAHFSHNHNAKKLFRLIDGLND